MSAIRPGSTAISVLKFPFVLTSIRFGGLKQRISISFSGGKTSAYMVKLLLEIYGESHDIVVTFANTGREHPETLEFIDRCDKEFGFNTVWLEAVVHHGVRKGCTHRVVDFATADRDGKVFEEVIKKYGIPNKTWQPCNREMKLNTMRSYLRSIGWDSGSYSTAVGIRADEIDRMSLPAMLSGVFYPCADNGITKGIIREWWKQQPFNLNIPEHWGNCVTCFKKSDRKLLTIARELPEEFDFNDRMEQKYRTTGHGAVEHPRVFFRGNRSAREILEESKKDFVLFHDDNFIPFDEELDVGGGCGSSCEIGADETGWDSEEDKYYQPKHPSHE